MQTAIIREYTCVTYSKSVSLFLGHHVYSTSYTIF